MNATSFFLKLLKYHLEILSLYLHLLYIKNRTCLYYEDTEVDEDDLTRGRPCINCQKSRPDSEIQLW